MLLYPCVIMCVVKRALHFAKRALQIYQIQQTNTAIYTRAKHSVTCACVLKRAHIPPQRPWKCTKSNKQILIYTWAKHYSITIHTIKRATVFHQKSSTHHQKSRCADPYLCTCMCICMCMHLCVCGVPMCVFRREWVCRWPMCVRRWTHPCICIHVCVHVLQPHSHAYACVCFCVNVGYPSVRTVCMRNTHTRTHTHTEVPTVKITRRYCDAEHIQVTHDMV